MVTEIKNLPEFVKAAKKEFYSQNPDILDKWYRFLGIRIDKVKHDDINEVEYIKKWR